MSLRLKGWDYLCPGGYFVTLCTHRRMCLFGEVVDEVMQLNACGEMIHTTWAEIPIHCQGIQIDAFVIMPDHFHGIISIEYVGAAPRGRPEEWRSEAQAENGQAQGLAPTTPAMGDVIGRFKTMTLHRYKKGVNDGLWEPYDNRLWQRGYYDHILRDDADLAAARRYIRDNPLAWALDCNRDF